MKEQNGKSSKKQNGFLKALSMCFFGLLFGFFAAMAFYGVRIAGQFMLGNDFLVKNVPILQMYEQTMETIEDNSQDNPKESNDEEKMLKEDVPEESVVYTNTGDIENTEINGMTTVTDVSEIVKAVMPAIVSIVNEYTVIEDYGYLGSYEEAYEASGTGIIVGENETEIILVTNYHVIEDADRLEITFADGSSAEALVKGTDEDMDLAVIAVDIESLSTETKRNIAVAVLGDSDNLEVGEPAIAIGNALGYGQSVTTGVISALDRQIDIDTGDAIHGKFIQTDAAINPGNSGGALLNMKGEVVGINSNKIGGDSIEGMGYAIPITEAMPILEELMTKVVRYKIDEEDRGYIGIIGYSSIDYMYYYGGDMPYGVYVEEVNANTGAEEAGIKVGDVITKFGDYDIESMSDLDNALWYYPAGETVTIEVYRLDRDGEYQCVTLRLTLGNKEK